MDRGFGGYHRGSSNQNFRRDDRRHDDFYSDNRDRRSGSANFNARANNNRGSSREQGFFGNQGHQGSGQNSVIAALQLQNQNLLNAYIRNQSQARGTGFQQQRNRYQGGSGGFRPGDKRRQDNSSGGPSGFKRNKPSSSRSPKRSSTTSSTTSNTPRRKDSPKVEKKEEELPDIPDDQVEVPDSLMDSVEKLRQRKEVERNVADEDVDKLVVFCFNGKGYQCLTCGLLLTKDVAFRNHLMAKGHVMNVIDARSAKKYQETREILDIDLQLDGWYEKSDKARNIILKQAKLIMKIEMEKKKRELDNFNRDPKNFFAVNMASKKTATMKGDTVRITSIVQSTIDVKEFSNDRFFGCEFVKSVASFQCRLCDAKIQNASEVIAHIDGRVHRNRYQLHLKRNPNYEKTQKEQNKELGSILQEHEGDAVLLSETPGRNEEDGEEREQTLIDELDSFLVRVPEILNPPEKEDVKEEEEKDSEKETEPESSKGEAKKETEDGDAAVDDEEKQQPDDLMEADNENDNVNEEPVVEADKEHVTEEVSSEKVNGDATKDPALETINDADDEVKGKSEVNEEEKKEEVEEKEPTPDAKTKKSSLKKTPNSKPRGGTAKRGSARRTRGGKVTPSPRTRRKQVEDGTASTNNGETAAEDPPNNEEIAPEQETAEDSIDADGSFMDTFHVVDEVQED